MAEEAAQTMVVVAVEEEAEQPAEEPSIEEEAEEEEDLVDPQDVLKEKCSEVSKCSKLKDVYETCNERVNSRTKTTEECTEELFDFLHCVDKCVANNLFQKLK